MNLKNFMVAITEKLNSLYPDKIVHIEEIPNEADGNFYIHLVDSSQETHLGGRRKRILQFEVLYFCKEQDMRDYLDWAEVMYDNFERLSVVCNNETGERRSVALRNQKAHDNKGSMAYQFLFDAEFYFVMAAEEEPMMENLIHDERMKT